MTEIMDPVFWVALAQIIGVNIVLQVLARALA